MKNYTNNPYVQQILDKGRDYTPTAAPKQEFPKTIYGRTFETQEEYNEAIADFLNGNWSPPSSSERRIIQHILNNYEFFRLA